MCCGYKMNWAAASQVTLQLVISHQNKPPFLWLVGNQFVFAVMHEMPITLEVKYTQPLFCVGCLPTEREGC